MKLLPPCRAAVRLLLPRRAAWRLGAPVDLTAGGWSRWLRRSGSWRLSCTPPGLPSRGNTTSGGLSFSLLFASATLQLVATLARFADPVGAWWLSPDVLLLPQSLLPLTVRHASGVLGALPPQHYRGEQGLLWFQNLHRYFLYPALVLVVILWIDAIRSYFFPTGFGIGWVRLCSR